MVVGQAVAHVQADGLPACKGVTGAHHPEDQVGQEKEADQGEDDEAERNHADAADQASADGLWRIAPARAFWACSLAICVAETAATLSSEPSALK